MERSLTPSTTRRETYVKRKLFSICVVLGLAGGIAAVTSPAMAATAGPTTRAIAAATRATSLDPLTSAALTTSAPPTLTGRQTAKAAASGLAWCDAASPSYCINLRFGRCSAGTVVQGWRPESLDDYEAIEVSGVAGYPGRLELSFDTCHNDMCIAHASDHDLYLSACSSTEPDTWVEFEEDGYLEFSPGGGAYMWANSVEGTQMGLSGTLYGETEWNADPVSEAG
jgi:hypothetical protein